MRARFFFDAGVFFWPTVQLPTLPEPSEKHKYSLRDLGWTKGIAKNVDLVESFEAARLTIYFTDGRMLQLNNAHAQSWIGEHEPAISEFESFLSVHKSVRHDNNA